jgi:hypothetical protein
MHPLSTPFVYCLLFIAFIFYFGVVFSGAGVDMHISDVPFTEGQEATISIFHFAPGI